MSSTVAPKVGSVVVVTWEKHIFDIYGKMATICSAPPKHGGSSPDRDGHYWGIVTGLHTPLCLGKPEKHFEVIND